MLMCIYRIMNNLCILRKVRFLEYKVILIIRTFCRSKIINCLFFLLVLLFSSFIAVSVTVAIALTVTVLGTVTVAVTVLTLAHVDVVDNGCQFRELMLVAQHIDVAVAGFRGYVGTAYIYADVCHTTR